MLDLIAYALLSVIFLLVFICVFKIKDFFSRVICLNSISNLVALFIANLSAYDDNGGYIDIALIYMLLSYVLTIALLKINKKA